MVALLELGGLLFLHDFQNNVRLGFALGPGDPLGRRESRGEGVFQEDFAFVRAFSSRRNLIELGYSSFDFPLLRDGSGFSLPGDFVRLNENFDVGLVEGQAFSKESLHVFVVSHVDELFVNIFEKEDTIVDFFSEEISSLSD